MLRLFLVCYRKHPAVVDKLQVYLHGLHRLPIYCQVTKLMSTRHCINVLLDPELNPDVVCGHVLFGVNCNSSFVVDLNRLSHPKDILCDVMGAWKWSGSYRSWLSIDELGDVTVVGKEILGSPPSSTHYRIWKRYYCSKSSPDVKMVVLLEGEMM